MLSEQILLWLQSWGDLGFGSVWAIAIVFVFAAFLPIPRTILIIGCGTFFGLSSLFIVVPSAWLGSILSFSLSRFVLRDWFQRMISGRPLLRAISCSVEAEGWRVVALLRLGVPIPSALQNYLFGVSPVRFLPYAIASLFFSFPQIALFAYVGHAGKTALTSQSMPAVDRAMLAFGTVLTICLIFLIGRRVRTELQRTVGKYGPIGEM